MDPDVARSIAHYSHRYSRDRFGDLRVEHAARVAARVSPQAEATAWLHDVLEGSDTERSELCAEGLTSLELAALELLTRTPSEDYEVHVLRIAYADGDEGRLAREVKLAALDDRLARGRTPLEAPPYAWARRRIAAAHALHRNGSALR